MSSAFETSLKMIPPRKQPIPPRPMGKVVFQPNALFENEDEMRRWIAINSPGATIVKTWKVEMLACTIKIARLSPKKKKTNGSGHRAGPPQGHDSVAFLLEALTTTII